jgi:hypothetical protein
VKQKAIFFFWLPLAFSWLLMTFEGPWVQGVISRKPDPETQLAAFGLVMSLSVTIEAPVIMLLATSTALSRDRQSYQVLWRYMMGVNLLVTIVAALMAFTPLLDVWLGAVLGIPQKIIDATRPGMMIMVMWSAFIGYRRFYQGILIRKNHTRAISNGTIVRIVVSAGLAFSLGGLTGFSGVVIGSLALVLAVGAEAVYIYWRARDDVDALLNTERDGDNEPLNYRTALRFHIPLAMTSLMTLLMRPVIDRGLASVDNPERALAAWPVVFAILLVMRSGGMAWQEVVIALSKGPKETRSLRRFTWALGLATSGLTLILAFTPLIDIYIGNILSVPENLHSRVMIGTRVAFLLPFLTVFQSYFRAMLMRSDTTSRIYQGMAISLLLTAAGMWVGVELGLAGLVAAGLSLTIAMGIETVFLWVSSAMSAEKLHIVWQKQPAPAGD